MKYTARLSAGQGKSNPRARNARQAHPVMGQSARNLRKGRLATTAGTLCMLPVALGYLHLTVLGGWVAQAVGAEVSCPPSYPWQVHLPLPCLGLPSRAVTMGTATSDAELPAVPSPYEPNFPSTTLDPDTQTAHDRRTAGRPVLLTLKRPKGP